LNESIIAISKKNLTKKRNV